MPDRFYCNSPLHNRIELIGSEFHHLVHVMRNQVGDVIEFVNGHGDLATAKFEKIEKNAAILTLIQCEKHLKPEPSILIGLPILRMDHLEWAIEKATELGADAFHLFLAQYSEKKQISEHQLDRLRQISIAAMKQCKRLYLPPIILYKSLQDAFVKDAVTFFGDTNPQAPMISHIPDQPIIQFISGPEKGFSSEEIEFLKNHAQGIKLHPNILRAETAPLAALSLLSQKWLQG